MGYMIIDSHTHIIRQREPVWGWGPHFKVEDLIATLDREYDVLGEVKHVSKAIVMTGLGLTSIGQYNMREAHEYVIESVQKYPGRLYMNPVINPRSWVPDQLGQLRDWKRDYNLCMLKIHPSMHNYYLPTYSPFPGEVGKKLIYPIFEMARELGVPVMIHMGESPYSFPALIAPLANVFKDVPIVVAHSGANNAPTFANDAILLARSCENIFLGTSWVQTPELTQMYYAVGASRIIFESDCAPLSLGQQLRMVTNLHLPAPLGVSASKDDIYKMIGGNIAGLCHISTDEPTPVA